MPDHRGHRGPHPEDLRLFAAEFVPVLRAAVRDLSWLLTRDYASPSSLKLVGDRYRLDARQRTAVSRCACSDQQLVRRQAHRLNIELSGTKDAEGNPSVDRTGKASGTQEGNVLWIDGYNVLTTLEAALSGGVIIRGRDSCLRDMASMHGSYHRVAETLPAIELLGSQLSEWNFAECRWLFDQSVSNSGRLRSLFLQTAESHHWNWTVDLVPDPDPILASASVCIASADSQILDQAQAWVSLAEEVVLTQIPGAWIVDLSDSDAKEARGKAVD